MRRVVQVGVALVAVAPWVARAEPQVPVTDEEGEVIVVVDTRSRGAIVKDHRAVSVVERADLEDEAPRTTPEALALAPGVSVQKTNHAGGSPFLRGVTGQQTLLMIDGFRLNTSIMRSGPNQYFNTIDAGVVDRIEVLRGAGSVLYGSDAIGGVINVATRNPAGRGHRATVLGRTATAEQSAGGRVEYDGVAGDAAWLVGVGGRSFGNVSSGGPPALAEVPLYDGDEQLFTEYDEVSGDAKVRVPVGAGTVTAAALAFRQYDAPRTDKCTSIDPIECRFFDEQFYDLGYLRYAADHGPVRELDVGLAFARTHERRSRHRGDRDLILRERDRVLTVGLTARASTPTWRFADAGAFRVSYGSDLYVDSLASDASDETMSSGAITERARGKYLDGSTYLSAAAFGFGELVLDDTTSVTFGARANAVRAGVAADPEGMTDAFSQWQTLPVVSGSVRVRLAPSVFVVAGAEQGFRAPNLDDLTAISSEGPGFQIANPDLSAESSLTLETGVQVRHRRVWVNAFTYATFIEDFIGRTATECPAGLADRCGESDNVFTLVNADAAAIRGAEVAARAQLPLGMRVFGSVTWTEGEKRPDDLPAAEPGAPLSKMPPVHGVVGIRVDVDRRKYFAELVGRWALGQDRLSAADIADPRIPPGGTPGYGVLDLRAGARVSRNLRATLAVENLFDDRYRVHGSGVDGAGFGVVIGLAGTISTD